MNIESYIPKKNIGWNKVYFDVPDIWAEQVKELIEKIIEVDDEVQFTQIKTKWGKLTVYFDSTDRLSRIIDGLVAECSSKLPETKRTL
jgi:tryptophan 2,3-dioxygenase